MADTKTLAIQTRWRGHAPRSDIRISASRSSGPGGQNVNKTSTKVEVRFPIYDAHCLSQYEKILLRDWITAKKPSHYSRTEDAIVVTDSSTRSQNLNKEHAVQKLNTLITQALTPKIPRIKTKKPSSADRKRLSSKKLLSHRKSERQRKPSADD